MGGSARLADTADMESVTTHGNKVFLVEDSPAIRMRLATMLGKIEGVTIAGEAQTSHAAIEGILRTRPDSVILDIHLIGGSGIEVLRKIRPLEPGIVFIVLTNDSDPHYRKVCMQAGANYFLDKSNEFEKVRSLVENLGPAH